MQIRSLKDFVRGWFIGNFEPSVLKAKDFEVGVLTHPKGENWPRHYHKIATEINVLLEGSMTINNTIIETNTVFTIEPNESTKAEFLTDCKVLCIKVPSVPGDKYAE